MKKTKSKLAPLLENVTESTAACLVAMVQGNLFAISMTHWLIASRTGLIAGVVATVAILLARADRRWLVSITLGLVTGIVDFWVHPGGFGAAWMEAALTGLGAAVLSFLVGTLLRRSRRVAAPTIG